MMRTIAGLLVGLMLFVAAPAHAQAGTWQVSVDGKAVGTAQSVTGFGEAGKAGQVTIAMADPKGMAVLLDWYNRSSARRSPGDRRQLVVTHRETSGASRTWTLDDAIPRSLMNRQVDGEMGIVMVIHYAKLTVN